MCTTARVFVRKRDLSDTLCPCWLFGPTTDTNVNIRVAKGIFCMNLPEDRSYINQELHSCITVGNFFDVIFNAKALA
jgi:hypothetical protein